MNRGYSTYLPLVRTLSCATLAVACAGGGRVVPIGSTGFTGVAIEGGYSPGSVVGTYQSKRTVEGIVGSEWLLRGNARVVSLDTSVKAVADIAEDRGSEIHADAQFFAQRNKFSAGLQSQLARSRVSKLQANRAFRTSLTDQSASWDDLVQGMPCSQLIALRRVLKQVRRPMLVRETLNYVDAEYHVALAQTLGASARADAVKAFTGRAGVTSVQGDTIRIRYTEPVIVGFIGTPIDGRQLERVEARTCEASKRISGAEEVLLAGRASQESLSRYRSIALDYTGALAFSANPSCPKEKSDLKRVVDGLNSQWSSSSPPDREIPIRDELGRSNKMWADSVSLLLFRWLPCR